MQATPKVLCCGNRSRVTLGISGDLWGRLQQLQLLLTTCDGFVNNSRDITTEWISGVPVCHSTNGPDHLPVTPLEEGVVSCEFTPTKEGEYILRLVGQGGTVEAASSIYAVEKDLIGMYPWKGDLHLHSTASDGMQSPREIAVAARRAGYSFLAVTDHGKMEPSLDLIADLSGFSSPYLKAYAGEEIHLPGHQVHILNIGGTKSVNQAVRDNPAVYENQREALQRELPADSGADPEHLAAALWAFGKVREAGGLSVLCHPYWRRSQGYDLGTPLSDALLDRPVFDAVELVSGYPKEHTESNLLQLARYGELLYRGIRLPIVGASDAHDCGDNSSEGQFRSFYTLVLAPNPCFEEVALAIRECRSVAAHQLPGEQLRLYGPYRYVKYLLFLCREFFPCQDALAQREASLLSAHFAGQDVERAKWHVWYDIHQGFQRCFGWNP